MTDVTNVTSLQLSAVGDRARLPAVDIKSGFFNKEGFNFSSAGVLPEEARLPPDFATIGELLFLVSLHSRFHYQLTWYLISVSLFVVSICLLMLKMEVGLVF